MASLEDKTQDEVNALPDDTRIRNTWVGGAYGGREFIKDSPNAPEAEKPWRSANGEDPTWIGNPWPGAFETLDEQSSGKD